MLTRYDLLRARLGTRAGGVVAALVLEALLVLLLFSVGSGIQPPDLLQPSLTSIAIDPPPEPEDPPEAQAAEAAATAPDYRPSPLTPPPAPPAETPSESPIQPVPRTAVIPLSRDEMEGADIGNQPRRRPDRQGAPSYGPAAPGPATGDSDLVGTAPDGSPLYGARWYTEPSDEEMRGYLSTANPGWALIACRTAPGWRVEDCVGLSEFPAGSNMLRAVLAATWQFRVRPPRRNNQSLVGSWVRIRISYDNRAGR